MNEQLVFKSPNLFIHSALEWELHSIQNPFLMKALCMSQWNNEWIQQSSLSASYFRSTFCLLWVLLRQYLRQLFAVAATVLTSPRGHLTTLNAMISTGKFDLSQEIWVAIKMMIVKSHHHLIKWPSRPVNDKRSDSPYGWAKAPAATVFIGDFSIMHREAKMDAGLSVPSWHL